MNGDYTSGPSARKRKAKLSPQTAALVAFCNAPKPSGNTSRPIPFTLPELRYGLPYFGTIGDVKGGAR